MSHPSNQSGEQPKAMLSPPASAAVQQPCDPHTTWCAPDSCGHQQLSRTWGWHHAPGGGCASAGASGRGGRRRGSGRPGGASRGAGHHTWCTVRQGCSGCASEGPHRVTRCGHESWRFRQRHASRASNNLQAPVVTAAVVVAVVPPALVAVVPPAGRHKAAC